MCSVLNTESLCASHGRVAARNSNRHGWRFETVLSKKSERNQVYAAVGHAHGCVARQKSFNYNYTVFHALSHGIGGNGSFFYEDSEPTLVPSPLH